MNSQKNRTVSDNTCPGYLSCFDTLTDDQTEMVKSGSRQIIYNAGETILKQGLYSPYVIFLISGFAKMYLEADRNRQIITHLAGKGDFISFSPVFNEHPHKYSASALTDCEVCLIETSGIRKLLHLNSTFGFTITARNWQTESRLIDLLASHSLRHMPGRLATAILYLNDKGGTDIFNHLSRKDLAGFANINAESTVKLLKEFEQDGIISLNSKEIIITKRDELEKIALRG
ncbi:MAG: Crp/Fnr family transcriptional regulator [Bacteroidales bacterium]|nr:Crp/Fnr family transcriptional regulator [Bacteroidales bacterium]